jgi:3D (Asp-Asp-Asp) domain-containing protein
MAAAGTPGLAKVAGAAARAIVLARARRRGGSDGGGSGPGGGALALLILVPFGAALALVLVVGTVAGVRQLACVPGGGPLPPDFSGPGSLGGAGGTGISRALVERVRSTSPYASTRVIEGRYAATAYGPPWGGIQGPGVATSGGLPIGGGAPRWYMIAVDPRLIGHGSFVYIWPNPFGWRGPFFAADTGGAIIGNRIDFYDWRGRESQLQWAMRDVALARQPLAATRGGPPGPVESDAVPTGPGSTACHPAADGSLELPGPKGQVTVAPGADRLGVPTQPPVLDFLARVAGVAARPLVITTGSNHSRYTSSGHVSDHWIGMAADLGSVANGFELNGSGGTRIAAAGLHAAGVSEAEAWRLANAGGGHDVCFRGWRVQVIWRTGDHYDHIHIGLRPGCSFGGVRSFEIS